MYKNRKASQLFCSEKENIPVNQVHCSLIRTFSLKASLRENTRDHKLTSECGAVPAGWGRESYWLGHRPVRVLPPTPPCLLWAWMPQWGTPPVPASLRLSFWCLQHWITQLGWYMLSSDVLILRLPSSCSLTLRVSFLLGVFAYRCIHYYYCFWWL